VFVGSSVEGLPVAEAIRLAFSHAPAEVHLWSDPLVREVLRSSRLGQDLEIDGPHQVRLHGALGELTREHARFQALVFHDAANDVDASRLLAVPRGPVHQDVLTREQRERNLLQDIITLDEDAA
jgi:hypothetical protein